MTPDPVCLSVADPLLTSIRLVALWLAAGLGWCWIVPLQADHARSLWLMRSALTLVLGAVTATLVSLVRAEYAFLCLPSVFVMQLTIGLIGAAFGARAHGLRGLAVVWRAPIAVALGTAMLLGGLIGLPCAGEWIVGGWDPGVYVGQGAETARTGSFHPQPQAVYQAMTAAELERLTRNRPGYHEIFAGVPINPDSRSVQPYFFRLYPAWIALLALHGDVAFAVRANLPAGILAVLMFAALLASWGLRPAHIVLSVLVLAAHPLWLFALRLPTTEVLHAALLFALFMLATLRGRGGAIPLFTLVLALAGVLNRFDALFQGTLLLAALAWLDAQRADRRRVLAEHLALAAGLWIGVGLDALWCGVTLDKISRVARPLMQASAGIACLALLWDACAPRIPRLRDLAGRAIGPSALSVALAALALLWIAPWPPLHEASQLFRATLRYLGPALAVCAFAGALFFLLDPQVLRDARALLLVALVLSAALLVHSHIVPIYPWATRRFVSFCLPALAVLAAAVPARLWKRGGRLAWTGWALSAALVAAPMRDAQAAWQITEYDGVTAALSEAVRQLPEDAVVIADHHWWGAPLIHLHGKAVINGARLWQPASPDGREAAWQAMSRLRASGFHFVFLTSTPEGIGVYPDPVEGAKLLWSGEPLTLCELMHHRKPIGFVAREHPVEFRVYDWPLSSPAAGR